MLLSPELVALFNALAPYVVNIGGLIIAYLTLSGKQKKDSEESRAIIEKDKLAAKTLVDEAYAASLEKAREKLDLRNKELMDGVIKDNKDLNDRVGKLQKSEDERREADAKKDILIAELQHELKDTATECKIEIAKVLAQLTLVSAKLETALEEKGKAEQEAATAQAAAGAAGATGATGASVALPDGTTGQVAEGEISLNVVTKRKRT